MIRLVLFDIDGTLIRTGGAGVQAFARTFEQEFGLRDATRTLNFAGRTDTSLVRECFIQHNIPRTEDNFRRFFQVYPLLLAEMLRNLAGSVCPGVQGFISQLKAVENPPLLGLLTGNVRRGAELKLTHYGLWHHFPFGAFGDDHEERNQIAVIARARGCELLGRSLDGPDILVIGDTPLDIACARAIHAPCLAVATGGCALDDLIDERPALAVRDLTEVSVEKILSGTSKPGLDRT